MHSCKFFVTLLIFVISTQNVESKTARQLNTDNDFKPLSAIISVKKDLVSLKEIWQKVKTSVVIAWDNVKVAANNAKTKIKVWMTNVKKRAEEINKAFEEKLKNLKEDIHNIIEKVLGDGEIVKECLKQEPGLQKFLSDIIERMSACLQNNNGGHTILGTSHELVELNDTKFVLELENKLQACEKSPENFETCICKVRDDAFGDIETIETNLYNNQMELRMGLDNLLDALVNCSINGLIEATSTAATEALKITKCVINGSQNQPEVLKVITK